MATVSTKAGLTAGAGANGKSFRYAPLVLGWLVPGGGHFLLGKWVRGVLILVSVATMFFLGIAMQGKIYGGASNVLDLLGLAGDLGSGLCFVVSRIAGWGADTIQVTTADYGTRFMVMAGLLNLMAAVDAHNLSIGRKQDLP
uniref:DUF6677 domain-containing protein n=1 Tax=mine drainage metagenome TaxID=410659 RepID=E6PWS7_9ZZZZ